MSSFNVKIDRNVLCADATQIKNWFETGEIFPEEYLQQVILATEKINPVINAFISFEPARMLKEFKSCQNTSSLFGLPVGIKDNIDVSGYRTTAGMKTRRLSLANRDAFVIEKLKANGALIGGKLNMHEAALGRQIITNTSVLAKTRIA